MTKRQAHRPRSECYSRLVELDGLDAGSIAKRAGLRKATVEDMVRGRLRWDGKAQAAARELFCELHGDDPEKIGYTFRDGCDPASILYQAPDTEGKYLRRLQVTVFRGQEALDLRLYELPDRFGGKLTKTGIGIKLTRAQWAELAPVIQAAAAAEPTVAGSAQQDEE